MSNADEKERQVRLKIWINRKSASSDGFATLHYASFHGNLTLIRYLISKGASYNLTNGHKISMLHVAA
jgi:ankyrin repeat protein